MIVGFRDMPHHVLHVGGRGVDAPPQLVVQLEDLLAVRPADGPSAPPPGRVAGAVPVCFLLVAAQKLLELLGVGQVEGSRVPYAQQQEGEHRKPGGGGGGGAGHSDNWGCVGRTVGLQNTRGFLGERPLLKGLDTTCWEEMFNESFPTVWVNTGGYMLQKAQRL